MGQEESSKTEALLPVEIPKGKIRYAQGIKAGRWIFATGHLAMDYNRGISAAVANPRLPRSGIPKNEKEAVLIFDHLNEVLKAGGTTFSNVVRLDQYYTGWKAVDPYHVIRKRVFGTYIPPSTSILQDRLLVPSADMDIQMVAILPAGDFKVQALHPTGVDTTPTSGYAPVVKAGDYVFVAGQLASWGKGNEGGISPEARVPSGHLWRGTQIKLESEYVIHSRLKPALEAAGSSLSHVVKAQVYMSSVDDFPGFNEVWAKYFPKNPPAITLIPCSKPGFGIAEASIEINALALADHGGTTKSIIDLDIYTGYDNQSIAVRAGDLLLISGLMAVDHDGLIPEAEFDSHLPYFGSSIKTQMAHILRNAEQICNAAGTSLKNIVRIQQFHTDLKEFYPAYEVWQAYLPGHYLPFSAIQVPSPMAVPGATVLADLWVYAPQL